MARTSVTDRENIRPSGRSSGSPCKDRARRARRTATAVLSTLALTASLTALSTLGPSSVVNSASAAGCHRDGVSYKILGAGHKVWIGTSVFSAWVAGPATIQRTVTKAATSLQKAGLIRYSRGNISVLDRAGLKAASCACYRSDRETYRRVLG